MCYSFQCFAVDFDVSTFLPYGLRLAVCVYVYVPYIFMYQKQQRMTTCDFVHGILFIWISSVRTYLCIWHLLYWKWNFRYSLVAVCVCAIGSDFSMILTFHSISTFDEQNIYVAHWNGMKKKLSARSGLQAAPPSVLLTAQFLCLYTHTHARTRKKRRQIRWQGKNPLRTCTKYTKPCYVTLE